MSDRAAAGRERCRLYLITPERLEPTAFANDLAAALHGGDVACLQLRLKDASDDEIRRACEVLLPITQAHDVAFLVNDRADLAAEMGADGTHVGQDDMAYAAARALVGADAIVGVTCKNSRHLAMEAGEAGADYVAFGAFFPSTSKETSVRAEPDILAWWSELMVLPCVAIGGITAENCGPLVQAGADFLCVISAVWGHAGGPGAGVAALNRAIDANM